jgi:hypothetical protein
MHTYNFQEINLQKCSVIFCTKVYFAGHTFQCKFLISCRDKIWPTLWCIFVHSDSMSLSLSHLLATFSASIFLLSVIFCLLSFLLCIFVFLSVDVCAVFPTLFPKSLISVSDPDWIRIQTSHWLRIRNPDSDPDGHK